MKEVKRQNRVRYTVAIRDQAIAMRRDGMTHREIVETLGISLGSAHLWTQGITPTPEQRKAIFKRKAEKDFTPERRKKLGDWARIHLTPYRKKYTKEVLINKITDFHRKFGRIPLKREFNMYDVYQRKFGSWNNAIMAAGFEPHEVIFSKKFIARDGHSCDSFAEKIIDDWLHKNNIMHDRHISYKGTKMTADFVIGSVWIEYFGLAGVSTSYIKIIERKRKLCATAGLRLVEIYPNDLFSRNFKKCLGRIMKVVREEIPI